jgi:hypothetical protein
MTFAPGGAAPPSPPYERGVLSCWTTERSKKLQRRESNPLLSGYEPDGSPLAFAAIKRSTRRTCTGLLSVTDGPQRYLCLDGMKLDTHPGLAPGKIGFADR